MGVPRRLGKAVVEAPDPAAGHVDQETVEDLPAPLVGVEPLVQELPQQPAGLGDPEADRVAGGERAARLVLRVTHRVANDGQAEARDFGVLAPVDQFVDLAGLESLRSVDEPGVRYGLAAVVGAGKAPGRLRDHAAGGVSSVAHCQHRLDPIGVDGRIGQVASVGQRQRSGGPRHDPISPNQSGDRRTIGGARHRRLQSESIEVLRGHIVLPTHPHQGQAEAEQQPVAEIGGLVRARTHRPEVEHVVEVLEAPVGDFEQRHPIRIGSLGAEHGEIGPRLDPAVAVPGRQAQVDNPLVEPVGRIEREEDSTLDQLVAASRTERAAAEHVGAPGNLDPDDLGGRGRNDDERGEEPGECTHETILTGRAQRPERTRWPIIRRASELVNAIAPG